jgi:hypothetical protein
MKQMSNTTPAGEKPSVSVELVCLADIEMEPGEWTNRFRVGRFVCEMSYRQSAGLKAEWTPALPAKMSDDMWRQYRAGRDALCGEVAKALGQAVLVVEA